MRPISTPSDDASAAAPLRLPSPYDGVEVWSATLVRDAEATATLARTLSPAEQARAARFGRDDLRDRYIVGRATLREILGKCLRIAPGDVLIERGMRGRPHVVNSQADGLDFNVSHTRGVALIGVTTGQRIGVDIEHGERTLNVEGVSRKFMSPNEQATLAALDDDERRRALLRLWTCKEAMSKATGDALSAPMRLMDVATGGDLLLASGPPPYTPGDWRLLRVTIANGFLATVALWHHR